MKKLVTIGATAMMGFTVLGGFKGITQITENHQGPVAGMVHKVANNILGNVVYATEAKVPVPEKSLNIRFSFDRYQPKLYVDGNGKIVADSAASNYFEVTLLKKDGNFYKGTEIQQQVISAGDSLEIFFKADGDNISDSVNGIKEYVAGEKYVFDFLDSGAVNARSGSLEQQLQTDVTFTHTEIPGEPGWYGVVPAAITFTDDNKNNDLDATVKIVNADNQSEDYNGPKTISIKVKSTNGFELQDGSKEAVEYRLTNKNGVPVLKDQTEQELGTVDKTGTKILSKARLVSEAKESGTFVDTLNYHFIEQ